MRKNIVALVLVLALAGVFSLSCGGGATSSVNKSVLGGAAGTLVVFVRDTPDCNIATFKITITGATLTPQGSALIGQTPVPVLSPGQTVTLDLATLKDFSALLAATTIQEGNFSQLNLTLANPQFTVIDFTQSPPAPVTFAGNLTTTTVS